MSTERRRQVVMLDHISLNKIKLVANQSQRWRQFFARLLVSNSASEQDLDPKLKELLIQVVPTLCGTWRAASLMVSKVRTRNPNMPLN